MSRSVSVDKRQAKWSRFAVSVPTVLLLAAACSSVASDQVSTGDDTAATRPTEEEVPIVVPDVDTSISVVPITEVYFDTFDGGAVTLAESTEELRRRLLDAIPPIDTPVYGDAATGDWLEPDDLVLGYVSGDQGYAYPFKILNFHEIVNDTIDGLPILVSYCPLCGSGIVYDRSLDGEVLSFGNTSALYESDLVMVDRGTGSYWWQVAGSAIVGPLSGKDLTPLPSVVATWEGWLAAHPDTSVLSRETGFDRPYDRDVFTGYAAGLDGGRFVFPVGEAARDPRLAASTLVVAVRVGEVMRAYPAEGIVDPINDLISQTPLVVFPATTGAAVFLPIVDGRRLEFAQEAGVLKDTATGSTWNPAGVATAGALAGNRLEALGSRTSFWFALVGAFPQVELYRFEGG